MSTLTCLLGGKISKYMNCQICGYNYMYMYSRGANWLITEVGLHWSKQCSPMRGVRLFWNVTWNANCQFRVSSPVCALHTAITHALVCRVSRADCHWNSHEAPWVPIPVIPWVIAACNMQTGPETLKWLLAVNSASPMSGVQLLWNGTWTAH